MKLVVFGLSVSSSWGNGHATLWRGWCAALARRGHRVVFFERDVPYYAAHRDLTQLSGNNELILYSEWAGALPLARRHLRDADVAMVTSYCPDARAASPIALDSAALHLFFDLDSPVTLERLAHGEDVPYIPARGLADFDLVLSYAGGSALSGLRDRLGARRTVPFYGSVDPGVHKPAQPEEHYRADLSYLGTYAADRDSALRMLFVEPARRNPDRRFMIGGSMYDGRFPWLPNIFFVNHIPPADHPAFYCSARLNLNVTRRAMVETGYCPSGRLFEAAACGAPVLTDWWEGLDDFFKPGAEILVARSTDEAAAALDRSPEDLKRIAHAARERTLSEHTADVRVRELESILQSAWRPAVAEAS